MCHPEIERNVMLCLSISFKKADARIRQTFAFSKEEQIKLLEALKQDDLFQGGVLLSTCNRCELYASFETDRTSEEENQILCGSKSESLKKIEDGFFGMEKLMERFKLVPYEKLRNYARYYQGKQAVSHLYKVACGLDSMVLGEDEILHQLKAAYRCAKELGATDGNLNIIFQKAFRCAKQSKSETGISKTPVSIGTLTANFVEQQRKDRRQKVLVIGAGGQIGSIVSKDLTAKGISVIGTFRSHGKEKQEEQDREICWIPYDRRYDSLKDVFAVVSATTSPHYTMTREGVRNHEGKNHRILFVDLAIPYDIDREIETMGGHPVIGIDYFQELAKENNQRKQKEAVKIKRIISDCVEEALYQMKLRKLKGGARIGRGVVEI